MEPPGDEKDGSMPSAIGEYLSGKFAAPLRLMPDRSDRLEQITSTVQLTVGRVLTEAQKRNKQ